MSPGPKSETGLGCSTFTTVLEARSWAQHEDAKVPDRTLPHTHFKVRLVSVVSRPFQTPTASASLWV